MKTVASNIPDYFLNPSMNQILIGNQHYSNMPLTI